MFLLAVVVATSATAWGRENDSLKGRVINSKGEPIGYATVVAMAGESQAAGTTTDEKGLFMMTLAAGEYRLWWTLWATRASTAQSRLRA